MDAASLRDRSRREERFDEERLHLFALDEMVQVLRREAEYHQNGHTGVTIIKTAHLRIVLEAARAGALIKEHLVHCPMVVLVLEGAVEVASEGATRIAYEGEMIVVPHERERSLRAQGATAFLRAVAWDGSRHGDAGA